MDQTLKHARQKQQALQNRPAVGEKIETDQMIPALKQIEKAMADSISVFQPQGNRFLTFIDESAGRTITSNDYLQVLEMFYIHYHKKDEKKAQMYCLLRMKQILLAETSPMMRTMFPKIVFLSKASPGSRAFLERKRPFYQALSEGIEKRYTAITAAAAILLLVLLVSLLRFPFLPSLLLTIALALLSLAFGHKYVVTLLVQERIGRLYGKLHPVHAKFERKLDFASPKIPFR